MSQTVQRYSVQPVLSGTERHPQLINGDVHVWHSLVSIGEEEFSACLATLSADEHMRADRYRFEKDRRQFIVARGFLRRLIAGYLKTQPQEIEFDFEEFGKPFLKSTGLFFNLAHSGNHIAFGFSKYGEVGIDIEEQQLHRHCLLEIAETICTSHELSYVNSLTKDDAQTALMRLWTAKEACLKASGTGLQMDPRQIEIQNRILAGDNLPEVIGKHRLHPLPDFEHQFRCSAALALPV